MGFVQVENSRILTKVCDVAMVVGQVKNKA